MIWFNCAELHLLGPSVLIPGSPLQRRNGAHQITLARNG